KMSGQGPLGDIVSPSVAAGLPRHWAGCSGGFTPSLGWTCGFTPPLGGQQPAGVRRAGAAPRCPLPPAYCPECPSSRVSDWSKGGPPRGAEGWLATRAATSTVRPLYGQVALT